MRHHLHQETLHRPDMSREYIVEREVAADADGPGRGLGWGVGW